MGKKENNNKKFATNIKRSFRKIKYLDKTQSSYFIVTCFIAAFFMFTGVTYSYFTFSKNMHAATITIAKLNYILESPTKGYKNQKITVPARTRIYVDFSLKSLNAERTKYALNYETQAKDINVYYSETLRKNTSGIIGPKGSSIDMRVVIENEGEKDEEVTFKINGGYIQNSIEPSNINKGYFEEDLTIRTHIFDEAFENSTQVFNFPDKETHSFYKVECSNGVEGIFNTETWTLSRSNSEAQTSCDVYFKASTEENEIFYKIDGNNETTAYTKTKPDNNGLYKYTGRTCTNVKDFTFDEATYDFKIIESDKNALCVLNFKTDITLENTDRYIAYFDATGGQVTTSNKTILKGGKYGALPKPTYENHLFLGWFTEKEAGEEITSGSDVINAHDVKLYAHWSEAPQVEVSLASLKKQLGNDIFSASDDYGVSYYFKATSNENYIKYADLYWRIIRINGDGSLRLLYDGTKPHDNTDQANDRTIEKTAWNLTNNNDNKYVGYMYGYANGIATTSVQEAITNTTDSNMKTVLEAWYKANITDHGFQSNVSDNVFCNDRTTGEAQGYGTIPTIYNARNRIFTPEGALKQLPEPQLACIYKENAMTVRDSEHGTASLNYPVGLITMDEIALIGGFEEGSYLNRGKTLWTASPSKFDGTTASMLVYSANTIEISVTDEAYPVPVINLSAKYASLIEGEGTKADPYYVK